MYHYAETPSFAQDTVTCTVGFQDFRVWELVFCFLLDNIIIHNYTHIIMQAVISGWMHSGRKPARIWGFCPRLQIPPEPTLAKNVSLSSKKSLRPFTPEAPVFPPESRAIPPDFMFPKKTTFQCLQLLKLDSARKQIFCPTPPSGM